MIVQTQHKQHTQQQRPPALCLWYSSAESQSSSIALESLPMTPISWVLCVPGQYSPCLTGLLSGFQSVVWSPWFCFLKENNKLLVEITTVCRSSRVAYVSLKSSHCMYIIFQALSIQPWEGRIIIHPCKKCCLIEFLCMVSTQGLLFNFHKMPLHSVSLWRVNKISKKFSCEGIPISKCDW